jgi:hypothetical protein
MKLFGIPANFIGIGFLFDQWWFSDKKGCSGLLRCKVDV